MLRRLVFVAFLAVAACDTAPEGVRRVSVEQLHADLDAHAVPTLVDVRTAGEFAAGHVPGAVNIPLDELPARLGEVDKGKEVTVICQSGNRSRTAARLLAEAGYQVADVSGGTGAWRSAGFPTE